jgi:hypothetical protein
VRCVILWQHSIVSCLVQSFGARERMCMVLLYIMMFSKFICFNCNIFILKTAIYSWNAVRPFNAKVWFSFFHLYRENQEDLIILLGAPRLLLSSLELQICSHVYLFFSIERTVFYREKAAGMYSPLPYAFALVISECLFLPFIRCSMMIVTFINFVPYRITLAYYLSESSSSSGNSCLQKCK